MPGGVAGVLGEAARHGVTGCISISTTTTDCLAALEIAKSHANVWCSAGVHPLYSDKGPHVWENLRACAQHPKCVAWGELGLDNHYERPARDAQRKVLEEQLAHLESWKREGLVKPVVLHCREAFDDLIPVLRGTSLDPTRFVFHCFTGGPGDMRKILDFGAYVSFTGVVTYRNAAEVREAVKMVPDDRFMVETDAPFLSPEPHRGVRPCQPWMVSVTARSLAQTRGVEFERLEEQVGENTGRFFGVGGSR